MDPFTIALIAGGLGTVIGGLNYKAQRDNLAYQKRTQQSIFDREDNSIYRRVEDLRNSGLSPVLAAGQGASAGPIVTTQTPQMDINPVMTGLQVMAAQKDNARTDAQTDLAKAQAQQARATAGKLYVDTAAGKQDLGISQETGIQNNSSILGRAAKDIYGGGKKAIEVLKENFDTKQAPKKLAEEYFKNSNTPEQQREFERRLKMGNPAWEQRNKK